MALALPYPSLISSFLSKASGPILLPIKGSVAAAARFGYTPERYGALAAAMMLKTPEESLRRDLGNEQTRQLVSLVSQTLAFILQETSPDVVETETQARRRPHHQWRKRPRKRLAASPASRSRTRRGESCLG